MSSVLDFSIDNSERIKSFIKQLNENNDEALNLLVQLCALFLHSGSQIIFIFIYDLIFENDIPDMFKFEIIKYLLIYNDDVIENKQSNQYKEKIYKGLNHLCTKNNLPNSIKLEAIFMLMETDTYLKECILYLSIILNDTSIQDRLRYHVIRRIEKLIVLAEVCNIFFLNEKNDIYYRILSSQILLQYNHPNKPNIEVILLQIANNTIYPYNIRADACDTLINLGSDIYKKEANNIVLQFGQSSQIYESTQNVHFISINSSVQKIIQKLLLFNKDDTCDDTPNEISELLTKHEDEHIQASLERIYFDRTRFKGCDSTYTLTDVFYNIVLYIKKNKHKDELLKRLLEELREMAHTCTSGFISRLVNVLSGFDEELSIRISFEDQITSIFINKFNHAAQNINNKTGIFYNEKLNDVITLYLNKNPKLKEMYTNLYGNNIDIIIKKFLNTNKSVKIDMCIHEFQVNTILEMMNKDTDFSDRQNYMLFFGSNISSIKENLYNEFKDHITDDEFDLYIRKAITFYEGY